MIVPLAIRVNEKAFVKQSCISCRISSKLSNHLNLWRSITNLGSRVRSNGPMLAEGLNQQPGFAEKSLWFSARTAKALGTFQKHGSKFRIWSWLKTCDVIVLAVKPKRPRSTCRSGECSWKRKNTDFYCGQCRNVRTRSQVAKGTSIIRAMPNTPALVGEGMTALCGGKSTTPEQLRIAEEIFSSLGQVVTIDESHMNAVTGLSGCGPAYLYVVLESLTDAGIKVGLPRHVATQLAAQTVLGAAKMLQVTQKHPAALKDEVTTPAGCTIDGLLELEEGKLRVTLIKAVVQATKRARALAKNAKTEGAK
ncbi:pyrroline-5-carboxylate reductase [bacterium]|nr:pyrroline-5-carboxylate reductase [bacterium]